MMSVSIINYRKISVAVNRVRVIVHREVVTSVACRDGYQGIRSILVTAGNYLVMNFWLSIL